MGFTKEETKKGNSLWFAVLGWQRQLDRDAIISTDLTLHNSGVWVLRNALTCLLHEIFLRHGAQIRSYFAVSADLVALGHVDWCVPNIDSERKLYSLQVI